MARGGLGPDVPGVYFIGDLSFNAEHSRDALLTSDKSPFLY